MTTAIFSHGKESGPNGDKIKIMRQVAENYKIRTYSLDYRACTNAQERVDLLKNFIHNLNNDNLVLIGSSMGGYVSTAVANEIEVDALFLLCPALYIKNEEYKLTEYIPKCKHIEIIHGWKDEIIPFENSIKFAKEHKAILNLIEDNHRLQDSHKFIGLRFEAFLKEIYKF